MMRTGMALIVAIAATAAVAGCARKLPPGVLEGGAHVPPPPSEQHRVTPRGSTDVAAPAAAAPAAGLRSPAAR